MAFKSKGFLALHRKQGSNICYQPVSQDFHRSHQGLKAGEWRRTCSSPQQANGTRVDLCRVSWHLSSLPTQSLGSPPGLVPAFYNKASPTREVGECGETPGVVRGKNVSYSLASHVCLHQLNGFLEPWGRITKASAGLQACVSIWLLPFWHILLQLT